MYSFRFQRSSIDTEDDFADNVIIISSSFSPSTAVWPDWVIFERSWSQIFFKKWPNFMMTFWAILKNIILLVKTAAATFWATFVKIWATFYISIWSHCSTVTHLQSFPCPSLHMSLFLYLLSFKNKSPFPQVETHSIIISLYFILPTIFAFFLLCLFTIYYLSFILFSLLTNTPFSLLLSISFFACLTFCLFAWSFTLFIFLNNLPVYLYLSFSETRTFLCLPVSVESPLFIFSPFCPSCQIHFSTCVNFQMIC